MAVSRRVIGPSAVIATFAVAWVGCDHPATRPIVENVPPPPPSHTPAACPDAAGYGFISHLWRHELFAGCAPPPFVFGVVCDGACPTPCRSRSSNDRSDSHVATTYRYVDGHFAGSETIGAAGQTYNDGSPMKYSDSCTYDHGMLTSCTNERLEKFDVVRDAAGRIVKLADTGTHHGDGDVTITYDDHARVGTLVFGGGARVVALTYDDAGRLIDESEQRRPGSANNPAPLDTLVGHLHDALGRPSGSTMGNLTIAYDPITGRVATTTQLSNLGKSVTAFTYDAKGRPTKIVTTETKQGVTELESASEYDYDCAAP